MRAVDFLQENDKSKLRSTGSTTFYRTVGRETRPAWGNRIVKDFYDLDYNIPTTSFKIDQHFKNTQAQLKQRIRKDIQKSKVQRQKMELVNHSEILSQRKKVAEVRLRKRHSHRNPETIEVGALPASMSRTLGLCPFEFAETIQGRVERRLNHHIAFHKNRSSRINNQNPIFYNRHQDIDYSHSKLIQSRRTMAKFHPFTSYSQRKVFEPRPELDKVFDTERARQAVSPKRLKEAVRKFDTVLERRETSLNESARLTYETLPIELSLKKKAVSYSIQQSQRETYFSPQVISPRRGCFR